jgi:inhibitor of cysteine peptidase
MALKHKELISFAVLTGILCSILGVAIIFTSVSSGGYTYDLKNFSSYDELATFLATIQISDTNNYYLGMTEDSVRASNVPSVNWQKDVASGSLDSHEVESVDYSETNIQVAGVDEPDIVKTDGTYLYVLSQQSVYILRAYPVADAEILSQITLDDDISILGMFINGDHLALFGTLWRYDTEDNGSYYGYWWNGEEKTVIKVYDISDRTYPELSRDVEVDGSYIDSRMIGTSIYVVCSESSYVLLAGMYRFDETPQKSETTQTIIDIPEITVNGVTEEIPSTDIYYVDIPEPPDSMTYVVSFDILDDTAAINEKGFLIGSTQTIYVSQHNLYITQSHYIYPLNRMGSSTTQETTVIHRIAIDAGTIDYTAQGEVPGHILNQFSMDEYNGFFRIATTIGYNWDGSPSTNNVYILDSTLHRVSQIEGLAPGESIYAVRFLGNRAYLVTFVQVDPLFAIDLTDPYNPQVLGELKIPGYSDYLHPYDETHLIGVGKEVNASIDADKIHTPGAVYYTAVLGLKMALFDVSDISNPKEIVKVVIGDRGTDSPVLYDHKAFLFDRAKELLVIPVTLHELDPDLKEQNDMHPTNLYGEFAFQGAYVYQLNLDGFTYKGRITHMEGDVGFDESYWSWNSPYTISRSLYIGDVLYTISEGMVKMNDIATLDELASITLT